MPKDNISELLELINSLNKAEKRNFRLFLKSRGGGRPLYYGLLFDALEKKKPFHAQQFLQKHPEINPEQLSNLKISLYEHLLECLRQQTIKKDVELRIREKIDYASVLYNKGLLEQSRQMLKKVTRLAERYHFDELRFEMLYREKMIELHFSGKNSVRQATELRAQAEKAAQQIERINGFAGFGLQMHAQFVEQGYLQKPKEIAELQRFYQQKMPRVAQHKLTINEQIYFNRAQYWYHYLQQDFLRSYRYSQSTVQLIRKHGLEYHRPVIYLKSMNHQLNALFRMNEIQRFLKALVYLQDFDHALVKNPTDQEALLLFRFLAHHRINAAFMTGNFKQGVALIDEIQHGIKRWANKLESRDTIVLNYKFACLYFGVGNFTKALTYLNRIIHRDDLNYRQDIHGYARILRLVALYEQGEVDILFSNVRTTYQYFIHQKNLEPFHLEILSFLRKSTRYYPQMIHAEFDDLRKKMKAIARDPLSRKPFYYFDIISWLDSKVCKVPVAEVIQEKGLGHTDLFERGAGE